MDCLAHSDAPLPGEFENLDVLTRLARCIGTMTTTGTVAELG